jgi:hypothetical protein
MICAPHFVQFRSILSSHPPLHTHHFFPVLTSTSMFAPHFLQPTGFVFLLGLPACEGAGSFCGLFVGVGFGVVF